MQASGIGIFLPDVRSWLNIHSFYAVKSDDIKLLAERLYSTGLPAAAMIHPSGTGCVPKVLFWKNCSIVGTSVSDTQLISSIKRIPSLQEVSSIFSIHGCNDLAHCVFRYGVFFSLKVLFYNYGKPECTLACGV